MMRLIAVIAVLIVSILSPLWGAEERELAEELMRLMNVEQNLEQMRPQLTAMLLNTMNAMDVPDEFRSKLAEHQQSQLDLVLDAMSWPKMKDRYIDLYVDVFDASELEGLIDFYSSPVGKSFVDKMPLLMQRMMSLSQEQIAGLLPQIQADTEKFIHELATE